MNLTANVAANLGTTAQTMGPAGGSAGTRGAAVAGRSVSSALPGVGALPNFGAMRSTSAIPSFSELMLQHGVLAGARGQTSVVGDAGDGADPEKLDVEAATSGGEEWKPGNEVGLPAFCPFFAKAEVANVPTRAMSGEATHVGSNPDSGRGVHTSLPAPRVIEGRAVTQRQEANAVARREPAREHAGVSHLTRSAEPADTKRPAAAPAVVEPKAVTMSRVTAVGDAAAPRAATARVVSATEGETVTANEKEANPNLSGVPIGSGAAQPATSAQVAGAPALARNLQHAEGHVVDAKDLPKVVAGVKDGEGSMSEPEAAGVCARSVGTTAAITTGTAVASISAHGDADRGHAVTLAGKAVSPAGLGQANSVESSAGASLLHSANAGVIAQPIIARAGTSDGPIVGHSTAGGTFARMDSAAPPLVTESSPQRLAVGVRDAGLGWVEIRTHAAGGQVSAVLTAATSEAQATLAAHLPEVREYLAGQQVRVDQLSSEALARGEREGSSGGQAGNGQGGNAEAGNAQGESAQAGSARAGNLETRKLGSVAAMFAGDGEKLSYVNVRV